MKVIENKLEEDRLSEESKFIKNILLKARSRTESIKLDESYLQESNLKNICEDFNKCKIVITPVNEEDVVLAYDPKLEFDESYVTIIGDSHKGKREGCIRNVTIKLPINEFFKSLRVQ